MVMLSDTDQRISNLVEELFPAHYRTDGPQLVALLKSYYEFTEQDGEVDNSLRLLRSIRDISEVEDEYLPYHQSEMLPTIPQTTVGSPQILIRNLLDFYRSRGSEQSYKTLFRAVYGANV